MAPLREFLAATGIAPAYALFLLGGTGTRKSTALALALSHFGNFTGKSLPASFNDTANFIRKKAFLLKDAPIVVDDYHPVTSLQERKKMEATAQSLARAFGDGAERGRMKADLTLQEAMPPRGVAIISGEDTPGVGRERHGALLCRQRRQGRRARQRIADGHAGTGAAGLFAEIHARLHRVAVQAGGEAAANAA